MCPAGVSLSSSPPGAGTAVTHCHDTIFFSFFTNPPSEAEDKGSPDVVKVLDGHRDVVLGGEEEAVGDLAGILGVGGFSVRVPRIEFHPVLHLCPIKTRHHFVHYILQSFVSPEIGKVKETLFQIDDKAKHEKKNYEFDDDGGYLRESRGLVLWIWMSQLGHALLVSTCRMMHDLQTEHTEVIKLTSRDFGEEENEEADSILT